MNAPRQILLALSLDDNLDRGILAHPDAGPMDALEPFRVDSVSATLDDVGSG